MGLAKQSSTKSRIIFLDLIRAFAVLMMVQGHTVHTLLDEAARSTDFAAFAIWRFMRGFTAPVFMFTAGTVFAYLFRVNGRPFSENPRVKRGLKRFGLLILLGYLLRWPTWTLFDFSDVPDLRWKIFFSIDVLHCIGFGVLFVILLAWVAEKIPKGDFYVFGFAAVGSVAFHIAFEHVAWTDHLHPIFAGYLYSGSGSQFPLFPWLFYIFAGAFLGSYLSGKPDIFKRKRFAFSLLAAGGAFVGLAWIFAQVAGAEGTDEWTFFTLQTISQRIGFVLIFNAVFVVLAFQIDKIPRIIILVGRNTLLIYVVHLIILYGSPWNMGLAHRVGRTLGTWETVGAAAAMIAAMSLLAYGMHWLKIRNKSLVS
jgi:uncharacterized membrane protein